MIGFDSAGSLSIKCIEMMPSSSAGSSCSASAARNLSSPPAEERSRMMPSAAPRPVPWLTVMRATARIMFWKRAMLAFDHAVWFESAVR